MRHERLTDELQEQATLYAAGAMTEGERKEYARHLDEDQCHVCSAEVNELEAAISLLAFDAPSAVPSPSVAQRLMQQARTGAPVRPQSSGMWWVRRWWVEWITIPVALGAIVVALAATRENNNLRQLTDVLNSRIAQLEVEVSQTRTSIATLTSPDVRVVDLAGQGPNIQAKGRIFWDQSRRKWLFVARDLPRVATDKDYQLWFVPISGNPVSAAVFNTGTDGSAQVEIDIPADLTDLKAAAVTTEPAGGVPQPTGAFALLGAL
jgi:anti-sigma-K factor RskA